MGKKSTGRRRGIERGVAKHKIGSKSPNGKGNEGLLFGIREAVYFSWARKCFEFWFKSCATLYLTPFTRDANGQYVPRNRKGMLAHYFVWLIKLLMFLHKIWGLGTMILYEELKIGTFMCASQFIIFFVSFTVPLVWLVRPKETMDLLNSWPLILSCLKQAGKPEPTQYDDLSEALKLIGLVAVTQTVALSGALCTLIFSTLPTSYFATLDRLGLIPPGVLPRFGWQLLFFPLEYATYIIPMLSAPFAFSMLLMLIGVFRIYSCKLRKIQITNTEVRARVEHLYICQELYGRICYVWMKVMMPPTIWSISIGVIVFMFVSIRHTGLPMYLYAIFPYATLSGFVVIFWLSFDIVLVTRDFEYIRGELMSHESPYLVQRSKRESKNLMMRARAMRIVQFPIGNFADCSINVPIVFWDEVINQVLFLLSLA